MLSNNYGLIIKMLSFAEIIPIILSALLIIFVKCLDKKPAPIFGIYEQRNGLYWFKVAVVYLFITFNKIKYGLKREKPSSFHKLEKPQRPLGCEQVCDIVTLKGANKNEDYFIVDLGKGNEATDGFLFLKIKDSHMGVLTCSNFQGLKLFSMIPMNKWRLVYEGKMKELDKNIEHEVKIDGIWTSDLPVCDWSKMDTFNIAQCLAYERWSKTFFENLKKSKINYYGQFGTLQLKVTIEEKSFDFKLDTIRGHSVGNNIDPSQFHKAAIHQFTTETGDYFRIGTWCIPVLGSRLLEGFMFSSKDNKFYPVRKCSLQLYKYGGIDASPDDYAFTFTAGDEEYVVQVNVIDSPYIYFGQDRKAKCYLKMTSFDVNGIRGWGTAKWIYKNVSNN